MHSLYYYNIPVVVNTTITIQQNVNFYVLYVSVKKLLRSFMLHCKVQIKQYALYGQL